MKRINDYNELNALIMSQLRKGVLTNCFISKEEFERCIKNGNLFYDSYENVLLIFRKMEDYFKMNFYINDVTACIDLSHQDVIVCEVACAPNRDYASVIDFFSKNGMKQETRRVRLVNVDNNVGQESLNIEKGISKDYDEIVKLFYENFDKYIGCIPTNEDIQLDIINNNIYCYKVDNKVVGILRISNKNGVSQIKHLAVSGDYRRKGIAKSLVSQYLSDTKNLKKYVWTGETNKAAKNTYLSVGYKEDGYFSYVLKNG